MIRVLVVSRPIAPPWDNALKNQLRYLPKLGEIELLVPSVRGSTISIAGMHPYSVYTKDSGTLSLYQKLRLLFWLLKFNDHCDIIHVLRTPDKLSSPILQWLCKRFNKPVIQTIFNQVPRCDQRRKLFWGDQITVCSEHMKKQLGTMGKTNVNKISPGVDCNKFTLCSPQMTAESKQKLGIENRVLVLFPGHYDKRLGISRILNIAPSIIASIPKVLFVMACRILSSQDRQQETQFRSAVLEQGLENHFLFRHTVENMHTYINASDLILFPIINAHPKMDLPLVLIESMACGKTVMLGKGDPAEEVFCNSECGMLIDANSPITYKDKLIALLNDESARKNYGRLARKTVEEYFDIKVIVKKYHQLYGSMSQREEQ